MGRALLAVILIIPSWLIGAETRADPQLAELGDMSLEQLLKLKVVSAARHEQRVIESPRSVSVLTWEEIRKRNYRTIPEALNEMMGVLVQETNYGGGAPIIRGMIGNRILILIDGIRLNNSEYRLGPLQYLNTIDLYRVERIEVVRGPSSALYGSDALGGLINIVTRSPETEGSGTSFHATLHTRLSSADRGAAGRLGFDGHAGRLGFAGGISPKRFGDLRGGGGSGRQPASGYDEVDGDLKLAYTLSPRHRFEALASKTYQEDVRRTDLLVSGANLKYEWNPLGREMFALRYSGRELARWAESAEVVVSHQRQSERLFTEAAALPGVDARSDDRVATTGFVVELGARIGERQRLTYGFETYHDRISSHRLVTSLGGGPATWQQGAYPDGTEAANTAAFVQLETKLGQRLAATLGLRHTRVSIHSDLFDPSRGPVHMNLAANAWTPSAALSERLATGLFWVAGISKGFRAPNVNDATVFDLTGSRFEIPNPNLKPEDAVNYETGLKADRGRLAATVTGFRTDYKGLIDRSPATLTGLDWLDLNGDGVRDKSEPGIYQRQNIGRARMVGMEAEGEIQINPRWSLRANASWIRGQDRTASTPLSRIPPVKGLTAVRWRPRQGFWAEAYALAAGRQTRLSPGDRSDRRIQPGGTPGFATWNVRGGADLPRGGTLTLGLENLADKRYRWHGSGIDAPGRNLVLGLGWAF